MKKAVDIDKVVELNALGFHPSEIAKQLNCTRHGVNYWITKLKLIRYGQPENDFKINKDEELIQFVLGTLLGDGSLLPYTNNNSNLRIEHSIKQHAYIQYKFELLEKYGLASSLNPRTRDSPMHKSGIQESFVLNSKSHTWFTGLRDYFYGTGTKRFTIDSLQRLKPFGLAIWYMDDGYIVRNEAAAFCTENMSGKERAIAKSVFKSNFDIDVTTPPSGIIYVPKHSFLAFRNIVEPYVHSSMQYKLGCTTTQ